MSLNLRAWCLVRYGSRFDSLNPFAKVRVNVTGSRRTRGPSYGVGLVRGFRLVRAGSGDFGANGSDSDSTPSDFRAYRSTIPKRSAKKASRNSSARDPITVAIRPSVSATESGCARRICTTAIGRFGETPEIVGFTRLGSSPLSSTLKPRKNVNS